MTARKATAIVEFYAALVGLLSPDRKEPGVQVKPDPAVTARIRAYMALTMAERYGEHGPP
ncbi:MAG TPA: hypothetical protein VGO33_00325 [Gemmatimonadaceae bacterium]|nr:hypothetical protein [Gemmatimonadaceae bacterium]